jgi:hypothetical protein
MSSNAKRMCGGGGGTKTTETGIPGTEADPVVPGSFAATHANVYVVQAMEESMTPGTVRVGIDLGFHIVIMQEVRVNRMWCMHPETAEEAVCMLLKELASVPGYLVRITKDHGKYFGDFVNPWTGAALNFKIARKFE